MEFILFRKIVLIAVQNEGGARLSEALNALRKIGGYSIRFGFRGSYALIGYTGPGRRPIWVKQNQHQRRRGPSVLSTWIKLKKQAASCK